MKVLILAYPGTGKSYLAEHYENVSDFEFQHYRYDYGKYKDLPLEQLKGREDIRTPKKDYPENFFKDLEKELELREIVCVPMATSIFPILDCLKSKDVRIIFAIRNEESFNDLINDYIKRGSTTEFIERRKHDFDKFYKIVQETNFEKMILDRNEYLADGIIKLGIPLKAGKGYKNYK